MKISGTKSKCFHLAIFMNHNCLQNSGTGTPSITVIEFKIRNHLSSKSFPLWKRSTHRKVIKKLCQKPKSLLETKVGRWKRKWNDQIDIYLYRNQVVQGHLLTFELIIWIPKESSTTFLKSLIDERKTNIDLGLHSYRFHE